MRQQHPVATPAGSKGSTPATSARSACPTRREMWAVVHGECVHEEAQAVVQHCTSCKVCDEAWRVVCELSLEQNDTPALGGYPPGHPAHEPSGSQASDRAHKPQWRQEDALRSAGAHSAQPASPSRHETAMYPATFGARSFTEQRHQQESGLGTFAALEQTEGASASHTAAWWQSTPGLVVMGAGLLLLLWLVLG